LLQEALKVKERKWRMVNENVHFWEEVHNKVCLKCGHLSEWNGECSECEVV